MAAFASCRRSGAVRVMVLLLCALFIFATLGAPPAHALGVESVAVFGLASVLSAATAALGFKLASNEQGQATLQKMVQDFKTVAWATGFVLVGSKLNGLQNGMDYIKMQVVNGKTYLDERVFAWVQQWLAVNGVYDVSDYVVNDDYFNSLVDGSSVSIQYNSFSSVFSAFSSYFSDKNIDFSVFQSIINHYNLSLDGKIFNMYYDDSTSEYRFNVANDVYDSGIVVKYDGYNNGTRGHSDYATARFSDTTSSYNAKFYRSVNGVFSSGSNVVMNTVFLTPVWFLSDSRYSYYIGSSVSISAIGNNNTGLSGTDTLGKDVIDLTLDQILEKLKEWAQDWYDAGADSATNAATGAKDLPLTVATGAATANPSIAEDGPLVWFPSFGVPVPTLRTGETDTKTVDQGKENANTADKTEAAAGTVEETQTIIDSLLNWASEYISPDKGLFSKFPLCIPYDAYLLVCSALGVDALGVDDVVGSSPGDVQSFMGSGVEVYSDFEPVIKFKHELTAGGTTYPIEFTLDLTPFEPIVKLNRIFVTVYVLAELISIEYKRIRGS